MSERISSTPTGKHEKTPGTQGGSSSGGSAAGGSASGGPRAQMDNLGMRLAVAWTVVGVPLAYGIYQTVRRASALFTG